MPSYVVTGAARGIGLQFVKHFSADSANQVFAIVRNKSTATFLQELGKSNVTIIEADVTDPKALSAAAAEVAKATGNKLDYLINNAGSSTNPGFAIDTFPTPEALENDLLANIKANTISVAHSTNAFLPLLKNGSSKKVLTVSSGAGNVNVTLKTDVAAQVGYSVAKAAMNMVVAKFAAQYRDDGFVFLSICPGMVDTSATKTSPPTPGELEEYKMLGKSFSKIEGTPPPPLSTEEAVKGLMKVFDSWPIERSGMSVSRHGSEVWEV
ncbi:NAD(P)-binding protein [Favolaschia claudopus]|uniref:NAD(P)-binding protein n=1 Tax=Favolaschia claudopus TaxID=2862362 RepID=A0AAW0D598_9AGAR